MAEINFGEPQNNIATPTTGNLNIEEAPKDTNIQPEDEQTENIGSEEPDVTEETPHISETIYSPEEQKDPNKIHVTIADQETPIVVFFGPPACGKTMTLICLARYLKEHGYTVTPVTSFRPLHDKNYQDMCRCFDDMVYSYEAAKSTSKINFMLVNVSYNGKPICQILEGPGELYFHPERPLEPFPSYVHAIINSKNRKIWTIMVEPDHTNKKMTTSEIRSQYVNKINLLNKSKMARDKVIFLFNKIDETNFQLNVTNINYNSVIAYTKNNYTGIFNSFVNQNPITKLWKSYNCDFFAFQAGNFNDTEDGTKTYTPSNDEYPKRLWNLMLKRIRG